MTTKAEALPLLVLYTGGTIGMMPSDEGLKPTSDFEPALRQAIDVQQQDTPSLCVPNFSYMAIGQAIDSANLMPFNWHQIALHIIENYQNHSGFVILHGTDTMAYTASTLAYMLQGLTKPVVLTGSQRPLCLPESDATNNVINALTSAQILSMSPAQCEVCIAFDSLLLRGCRSTKVSSTQMEAFNSPSTEALGYFDELGSLTINSRAVHQLPEKPLALRAPEFEDNAVTVLHLVPGTNTHTLSAIAQQPDLKAIIFLSYGSGNMCTDSRMFCRALSDCAERGIFMLNISQCHDGKVNQLTYASGHKLTEFGVASGHDMTVEAAYGKLHYLIAQGNTCSEISSLIGKNWANELTVE